MGITTPLQPYFAIGLGAEPATPLEMARAYASLANGGFRLDDSLYGNEPRTIECIAVGSGTCKPNYTYPHRVLDSNLTAIEDQMLEGVIQSGTGTAAQLPGWTVAGKTGTTENFGDAWFVGFTPNLVTAVWVGYPDKLVPMLSQFHGRAVAGGTYPALIWKAFMQKALPYRHLTPSAFPAPSIPYSTPASVIFRTPPGRLELDNGNCRGTNTRAAVQRRLAEDGELQAERGPGAGCPRHVAREGEGPPAAPAAADAGRVATGTSR